MSPPRLALALVLLSSSAWTQSVAPPEQYRLRIEYAWWWPILNATLAFGAGEEAGTALDARDDLGLADERLRSIRGALQLAPGHKLRGGRMLAEHSGDIPAARRFFFGGTTFQASERVVSSLDGTYWTAEYEFDFVKNPGGYFGILVGGRLLDMNLLIEAPESGKRQLESERLAFPVLGAAARVYAGRLSFAGEVAGLSIGKRGRVLELEGGLGLHLSDRMAVRGSYRRLVLHGEDAPNVVDLKLGGWQVSVELSL